MRIYLSSGLSLAFLFSTVNTHTFGTTLRNKVSTRTSKECKNVLCRLSSHLAERPLFSAHARPFISTLFLAHAQKYVALANNRVLR